MANTCRGRRCNLCRHPVVLPIKPVLYAYCEGMVKEKQLRGGPIERCMKWSPLAGDSQKFSRCIVLIISRTRLVDIDKVTLKPLPRVFLDVNDSEECRRTVVDLVSCLKPASPAPPFGILQDAAERAGRYHPPVNPL